jgi:hypothetical protein
MVWKPALTDLFNQSRWTTMLTPFDKFLVALFTIVTILCGIAGAGLVILHLPPDLIPEPHKNANPLAAALVMMGFLLGYAVSLTVFGLLSRRVVYSSPPQPIGGGRNTWILTPLYSVGIPE